MKPLLITSGLILTALSIAACSGSTKSIKQACMDSGSGNENFCSCMDNHADEQNLSRDARRIIAMSMDPDTTQREQEKAAENMTQEQEREIAGFSLSAGLSCASNLF